MYNHACSSSHNTQQQDDMMPEDLCHGLYHHSWPLGGCSGTMRQFTTSWVMPGTPGLFYFALRGHTQFVYFALRGALCHFFISAFQSKFLPIRGNVLRGLCRHPWQSTASSGAMHLHATSWSTPDMLGFIYFAMGFAWGAKMQPIKKLIEGWGPVVCGCQSPNTHNNQIEDGIWTGGSFKKRSNGAECVGGTFS